MKKISAIIITAIILVTAIAGTALASRSANRANFVDSDNNGICDNRAESCPAQNANKKCNGANSVDSD